MPWMMRKLPNKNLYRVTNKITKRVAARGTTRQKAVQMIGLLHRKGYGYPIRRKRRGRKTVRKPRRTQQHGGRAIARGGFGCVFKPSLACADGVRYHDVTKVLAASDAAKEMAEYEAITKVDPFGVMTISPKMVKQCDPLPE